MSNTGVVQVSGTGNGVDFTIDDTSPFDQVIHGLRKYLVDNRSLWSKGIITINAGLRIGSREQLNELKTIIEKESGLRVARFWCAPETVDPATVAQSAGEHDGQAQPSSQEAPVFPSLLQSEAPARPLAHNEYPMVKTGTHPRHGAGQTISSLESGESWESGRLAKSGISGDDQTALEVLDVLHESEVNVGRDETPPSYAIVEQPEPALPYYGLEAAGLEAAGLEAADLNTLNYRESRQDTALFVKSTCRSGESIHYRGDVVVLGDVNPGAEIVATGDITVFGALRGLAHAGSGGLTKAAIIAYRLESPRLQIGPYAAVASNPGEAAEEIDKSTGAGPMIAYVRRRSIFVAPFVGRSARYSRGILYEG